MLPFGLISLDIIIPDYCFTFTTIDDSTFQYRDVQIDGNLPQILLDLKRLFIWGETESNNKPYRHSLYVH